jgi:broad specificity phosphatase PhoE
MLQAVRNLEGAFLVGVEGVTEVWLVRHADAYTGGVDEPDPGLSEVGHQQAERLARRIRGGPVYSSPARRALETARHISEDARVETRIGEVTFDIVDGAFVFTEKPEEVVRRMSAAIDDIAAAQPGRRVVVVTHAGAITYYLTHVMELEPGRLRLLPHFTSVNVVRALGDRRMVGAINDTAHLEP